MASENLLQKAKTVSSPYNFPEYKNRRVPEGVTFRLAKLEDQSSVAEFSKDADILDGRDYMADMWCEFVRDPNVLVLIAEKDGNIASLICATKMGTGRGVSGFGARVNLKYKASGIYSVLNAILHLIISDRYPDTECMLAMTPHVEFWLKKRDENKELYQPIMVITEHSLAYCRPIDDIKSALMKASFTQIVSKSNLNAVTRIHRQELRNLLSDSDLTRRMFPTGVINLAIQPFDALLSNLDFLIDSNRMSVYKGSNGTGVATSISFGLIYQCPIGTRYDIAYYCTTRNLAIAIAHILHHLGELVRRHHAYGGHITAQINYPHDMFHTESIWGILSEKLGLCKGDRKPSPALIHRIVYSRI